MNDTLIYTGKVTITLGKKRATGYNNGTEALFNVFATVLTESSVVDKRPTKFVIDDTKEVAIQRHEIVNTVTARFSGYLTSSVTDANKIELYSESTKYATLELDALQKNILTSVTPQKSALIEWELKVANKEV